MKEFINWLTGTRMLVADDREAEYLAAGHRLAAEPAPEPAPQPAADAGNVDTDCKPEPAVKPAAASTKATRASAKSQASAAKRKPSSKK